jgi:DNA-binding transcriptional LysR family regulator
VAERVALGGIDLNLLAVLGAVLDERNVTKASTRLSVSQPTVSRALGQLRRYFADELLVRSGYEYLLTPKAQALLPVVHDALRQVERTFAMTGEFDPATSMRQFSVVVSSWPAAALGGLLPRLRELAPRARLELRAISEEFVTGDRGLLQHDLLIAPLEFYQLAGESEVICRDRVVCVTDPANPRLHEGQVSLDDLAAMPHVAAALPYAGADPVRAALERLGITPDIVATTPGWLQAMFAVAGTDMVTLVPERLARRLAGTAGVTVTEPPFGEIELAEAVWWHPMHDADPALALLRDVVREVSRLPVLPRLSPEARSEPLAGTCQDQEQRQAGDQRHPPDPWVM